VRIVSWSTPEEGMDGVTGVLVLGFLDKSVHVNVFRESHGGGERQSGGF
jgi:hypothetical protein